MKLITTLVIRETTELELIGDGNKASIGSKTIGQYIDQRIRDISSESMGEGPVQLQSITVDLTPEDFEAIRSKRGQWVTESRNNG